MPPAPKAGDREYLPIAAAGLFRVRTGEHSPLHAAARTITGLAGLGGALVGEHGGAE